VRTPGFERSVLDISKLENYCLNPAHLRGRHKAQMFRSALSLERSDAELLRQTLLDGIRQIDAVELVSDSFGTRWRVDVPVERHNLRAVVRTIWIIRASEDFPRFVTCWVL
jgi:hypothetical protein